MGIFTHSLLTFLLQERYLPSLVRASVRQIVDGENLDAEYDFMDQMMSAMQNDPQAKLDYEVSNKFFSSWFYV